MSPFALPGATCCIEGIGERKNVPGDQEVLILGAHRMPIHAVGRDGDFGHEIRARKHHSRPPADLSATRFEG